MKEDDQQNHQPSFDPVELSGKYPKPKTYDEIVAERERLNIMRRARVSKYPKLRALALVVILLVATYLVFRYVVLGLAAKTNTAILVVPVFVLWVLATYWTLLRARRLLDHRTGK